MNRDNIARIIYALRRKWNEHGFSPMAINAGYCSMFAQDIQRLVQRKFGRRGDVVWGEDVDHCFFMIGGYCYDSESPHGKKFYKDLKYYRRGRK